MVIGYKSILIGYGLNDYRRVFFIGSDDSSSIKRGTRSKAV